MKETGLLFTPQNYDRTAQDLKTQTRRIIKPDWWNCLDPEDVDDRYKALLQCPFGTLGDRLYVKESLEKDGQYIRYRRGLPERVINHDSVYPLWQWKRSTLSGRFMPKYAARLWLEITSVRVERLLEISNDDAEAEGCQAVEAVWKDDKIVSGGLDPYEVYAELWDSINGEGSWNTNPWVWVLSYKRVRP